MYYLYKNGELSEYGSVENVDLDGRLFYGFEVGLQKGRVIKKVQIDGEVLEVDNLVLTDGDRYWVDNGKLFEVKNTTNFQKYIKVNG